MEVKELSAISSDEIISILKEEIKNYDVISRDQEVGTVISVGDGIASVYGIDHAMYGEIVTLETGLKGMVQDIKENEISCILFGDDSEIKQGTKVCRTGKKAGIPVGEGYIGRIVDALGAPIDGKGEIKADGYRPVENEAPGIVDRKSVSVPLETGILSIDSMFPIGRGQRELIIGDRQTGKTSIATDTIINQKGKDVICIYVAIGQKASTVARLVNDLKAHDALDYTTVFCSTASECAPLQYIVPYSATALAEYFMYQGKDVLIVYDDLSKHAVAYRALSLLLEPHTAHMYRADENDPWHYIWIVFTGLSVPSYLRACGLTRNNPVFYPQSYAHAVSSRVREPLRQILGHPDASKAFIIGQLHLFFDGLMENTAVQSKNVTTDINIANVYIAEAMRYIESRYADIRSLDEIAGFCNVTRSHLARLFRSTLHVTLQEYLINYRMDKAKELLVNTNLPIYQIAQQVGYEGALQFNKAFKNRMQVPPRTWRLQNRLRLSGDPDRK